MTLVEARQAAGLTQVELAERTGIFQQQISRLETGKIANPSLKDGLRILKALHRAGLRGVTLDELFPGVAA